MVGMAQGRLQTTLRTLDRLEALNDDSWKRILKNSKNTILNLVKICEDDDCGCHRIYFAVQLTEQNKKIYRFEVQVEYYLGPRIEYSNEFYLDENYNIVFVDEGVDTLIKCDNMLKDEIQKWIGTLPYDFVDNKYLVYDEDGVQITIENLGKNEYRYLLKENNQTKTSNSFWVGTF